MCLSYDLVNLHMRIMMTNNKNQYVPVIVCNGAAAIIVSTTFNQNSFVRLSVNFHHVAKI